MIKDDKVFFLNALNALEQRMRQGFSELKSELKLEFKGGITGVKNELQKEIASLRNELSDEIRYNGVLLEDIKSEFRANTESLQVLNKRMTIVENHVVAIRETIYDYPVLRETVQKHSRQLATLSRRGK